MNLAIKLILPILLVLAIPMQAQKNEWGKIRYEVQAEAVATNGEHAPFWLTSNRHGLSSLQNYSTSLSAGLFRDFDKKRGFTWSYGVELAGAWNHPSPFYIQQLYADVKYNCWDWACVGREC